MKSSSLKSIKYTVILAFLSSTFRYDISRVGCWRFAKCEMFLMLQHYLVAIHKFILIRFYLFCTVFEGTKVHEQ